MLPPLDRDTGDDDCNCSVTVALVLKSGGLAKGFRYYESGPSCWAILDEKDTELSDDEIVGWSLLPIFEGCRMINGVWISPQEGLPPLDEEYGHCSEEVAIVLKSGVVSKGLRFFKADSNNWVIFDGEDSQVSDDEVAYWMTMPSLREAL